MTIFNQTPLLFLIFLLFSGCFNKKAVVTSSPQDVYSIDSSIVSCYRTISVMSQTEFVVTLTILGSELGGMATIQEHIPEGCRAQSIDSQTGIFDFNENTVKILWVNYPEKNELKVSYLVTVDSNVIGLKDIEGQLEFSDRKDACEIPAAELQFDNYSIMVKNADDPTMPQSSKINQLQEMLYGKWNLNTVIGKTKLIYQVSQYYMIFEKENKLKFNTNANDCTTSYNINSIENITIAPPLCTKKCCDNDPLSFPGGLKDITYYHITENHLILKSSLYRYDLTRASK